MNQEWYSFRFCAHIFDDNSPWNYQLWFISCCGSKKSLNKRNNVLRVLAWWSLERLWAGLYVLVVFCRHFGFIFRCRCCFLFYYHGVFCFYNSPPKHKHFSFINLPTLFSLRWSIPTENWHWVNTFQTITSLSTVRIFWEGHKILRNLLLTFAYSKYRQK